MEIHQIIYVQTVAHYRNFSKAAMHLNITQPTLSQQIGRLEAEIGFPLFERTTRVVNLTDQGRAFLEYAEPLIQAYDNLNRRIETIRNSGKSNVVFFSFLCRKIKTTNLYESKIHYLRSRNPAFRCGLHRTIKQESKH